MIYETPGGAPAECGTGAGVINRPHHARQEGEMTALHIASFKRRRSIAHLEAALEALDLVLRCLDDADATPQS